MTLQQMQYMIEVYRTGSISGAAKNLFLAQSSLSASISSVENELGFPIFVRTSKGMIPTVQGSHVIAHAVRICESYRAMLNTPNACKRHIRISAPDYEPLNKAFVRLVHKYKDDTNIHFSQDSCCTAEVAKRLSAFELDIGILINHEERVRAVDTLLETMDLQRQQLACVPAVIQIGPGHRLYETQALSPEDLKNDLFVDNMNDPLIDNDFLKSVIRLSADRTVSVKNSHIQRALIAEGSGYTIAAYDAHTDSGFRNIPIEGVNYMISAVINPKNELHAAINTYIELIRKAFRT